MSTAQPQLRAFKDRFQNLFRTDGHVARVRVMPNDEANALAKKVEQLEARSHGRLPAIVRLKPHLLIPTLWDVVHDARILDPVECLLGPHIHCLGSSFIDKAPHSDGYVAWHQDATFWGLSAAHGATAWLALTPATTLSGCMRVLPGTHHRQLAHFDTQDPSNMLGAREQVRNYVDLSNAVSLELKPGEMSLHHPMLLHGSGPNGADHRRLGFVIRYVAANIRQEGGTVTLVRGRNLSDAPLERAPEFELAPQALTRHAEILRRAGAVIRREKLAHLSASGDRGTKGA